MNDSRIAENSNAHIFDAKIGNRTRRRDPAQECRTFYQRAVRVAVEEILRQVLIEPVNIGIPHGANKALVEFLQDLKIVNAGMGLRARRCLHGSHQRQFSRVLPPL